MWIQIHFLNDLSQNFTSLIDEELRLEDMQIDAIDTFKNETSNYLTIVLDKLNKAKTQLSNGLSSYRRRHCF